MKNYGNMDLGSIFDEVFEAAKDFSSQFQRNFNDFTSKGSDFIFSTLNNNNTDYYPAHSYPPANVYITKDRKLVFEFAVAGFAESDLNLQFQGDYMYLSAKVSPENIIDDSVSYLKHRLKFKDIEAQKYYVPEDKFDHEMTQAVYRDGILRVFVPPKEEPIVSDGIKIEIVREQ
ncbi:MAG: Hsp20/alpha crystallin family protein [Spirochaetaceae bacterium]|jgi:HSP20 family molecular chaperone IbpA|nr:Hsp20/alpha crystallin family protein [Spirochaetaceae bacterium]